LRLTLSPAENSHRKNRNFGSEADETSFEPFRLRMAAEAGKLSQADIGGVITRLGAATVAYLFEEAMPWRSRRAKLS
jgi:hypothetical protein